MRKAYTSKKDTGAKNNKSGETRVPKYSFYAKSKLSPYPVDGGSPFYLNDARNEKELPQQMSIDNLFMGMVILH